MLTEEFHEHHAFLFFGITVSSVWTMAQFVLYLKLDNIFFLPINLIVIFFLVLKSIILIKKKKIRKLISTGGYMSLPLVLAARFLKIDIYLIEPNKVLGRANRFFLNSCKKIMNKP